MKIKLLICKVCSKRTETTAKTHTHKCCGHRMQIFDWRFEE